ncbi:MAG TPA: RsiV family protein [Gammaproteobacteria bacterium]|jgi:hypothetical protein|nr:RsiV family protein [Gammaproteobacteria bacterium]
MKFILEIFLLLIISPLAFAEIEDSPVDNKSTYHISDNIDLVSAHDTQYAKKVVIKMVYPRLSSNDNTEVIRNEIKNNDDDQMPADNEISPSSSVNSFNEQVTQLINEEIKIFKQKVADARDYQAKLESSKVKNRLAIDYNSAIINLDESPIISIRFVMSGYVTGMEHPFRNYRSLNFDIESGRAMELSDLFDPQSNYLDAMGNVVNADLSKRIRSDAMLSSGSHASLENYHNWNINPHGLRITFDAGTVAPYAYGSQSVLIPYSDIKDFINPESPLGRCLAHRKRCMRDPLLTGGFIDEAVNSSHRRLNPVLG